MSKTISLRTSIFALGLGSIATLYLIRRRKRNKNKAPKCNTTAYEDLIGNTPLILLPRLSSLIGASIYVKMESMNPGGSGKDRAALSMLLEAEESGMLPRGGGGFVMEGTSGSTGISLAHLCRSRGHTCILFLPDDQAQEKASILKSLGAEVKIVPNCAISNPGHYVNRAKRAAEEYRSKGELALFMDQFDNLANYRTHYENTGPEIDRQLSGDVAAFIMSSGTGGTIAGVGLYLQQKIPQCKIILVDPPGSVLHNKIKHGVAFVPQQSERIMLRHRYDTLAEGIGLDRISRNFNIALEHNVIHDSIQVSDQEALDMAHWILRHEGILIGSSSAMNIAGAVRVASRMKKRKNVNIVTVICDSGYRHLTRFWNPDFISERGLHWPTQADVVPQCLKAFIDPTEAT